MQTAHIQHVDLVHFCHSDYGFTDHPTICREFLKRYIDIALDAVLATMHGPPENKFYWTAEAAVSVDDWWRAASASRRKKFLEAVAAGQMDVTAMPANQTVTLNRRQWQKLLHWLPEDLWQQVQPQSAVQNDVNAVARAGALALLDRGVHRLFTGINPELGGAPSRQPSAFWWRMPDGRRMFVWLGESYPNGFSYFEPNSWRRGPVPAVADTRYRPPRPGEIWRTDELSMRTAHSHLVEQLRRFEAAGYRHSTLLISTTNEWRIDSDPPFPPLADFVAAWHRMGLKPTLRLTTVSTALKRLEEEIGGQIPEYEGEWTDWWAHGVASGPRELAASRMAKRLVATAESPVFGSMDRNGRKMVNEIYEQLCLFDEHTWGHINSAALPDGLDVIGQYNEKSRLAYRPLAQAELLLSQRVRSRLARKAEGFYVVNTAKLPWSGWVTMLTSCLRADYRSVEDPVTGKRTPIELRNGLRPYECPKGPEELTIANTAATFPDNCPGMAARFWMESLEGNEIRRLRLSLEPADDLVSPNQPSIGATSAAGRQEGLVVQVDGQQWPTAATWPAMERPLFLPGLGDFLSVGIRGFAPRWIAREIFLIEDDAERERRRQEALEEIPAISAGPAVVERSTPTTVYSQELRHPRLKWITRRLELWNHQPRARLSLRLCRTSSEDPEVFFITFPLPCEGVSPRTSLGGMSYVPYRDQLPGTCQDFFVIDGWVHYETPQGNWLWVSRDAPLVTFGGQHVLARSKHAPRDTHRLSAMVFDNRWFTNFVGDSHGAMEFQFDLTWQDALEPSPGAEELAESLVAKPQVLISPDCKDDPLVARRLYRP